MNYIVLDLEWNQAAYKSEEEAELPFEIIEIGAVKLDSNCENPEEFDELVRPQVYPFLLRRTKEITGLKDADLDRRGVYFDELLPRFLEWCGKDFVFCIWGTSDITQLERNMSYYKIKIPWKYPLKYLDVQKLFALQEGEGKARRNLESAIEAYGIAKNRPFHRAVDDAWYTAEVLRRIDRSRFESFFSVDYFRIPKNRFEETLFRFETYSKFVTREYPIKEDLMNNRKVREIPCLYCRKLTRKVIPWFADSTKNYFALGFCQEHGMMKGRIRVKTSENGLGVFGVRTVKPCTPEDESMILRKRDTLKEKRKEHRKSQTRNKRTRRTAEKD